MTGFPGWTLNDNPRESSLSSATYLDAADQIFLWEAGDVGGVEAEALGDELGSGESFAKDPILAMIMGLSHDVHDFMGDDAGESAAEEAIFLFALPAEEGFGDGIADLIASHIGKGENLAVDDVGPGEGALFIEESGEVFHAAGTLEADDDDFRGL
jgi:hypothetical protein